MQYRQHKLIPDSAPAPDLTQFQNMGCELLFSIYLIVPPPGVLPDRIRGHPFLYPQTKASRKKKQITTVGRDRNEFDLDRIGNAPVEL